MRRTRVLTLLVIVTLGALLSGRSETQRVKVQSWRPPIKGWLYVIDATTEASRIFLVDPERAQVSGTIRTGYNPDMALSPRGDRLYVASVVDGCGQPNCDQLAVIDTHSGRVLSTTPIANRVHYKRYPFNSRMTVSPDGRSVYLLKWLGAPSGDTPVGLTAFDAAGERFLDGVIGLGKCGFGTFVPTPDDGQLGFHCSSSNEFVVYRLTAPGRAILELSVRLPWGQRLFAGHVYEDVSARAFVASSDRLRLFVTGGNGAISEVTLPAGNVKRTPVSGDQTEVVAPFAGPARAESARHYVGVGTYDGKGVAREIRIFDASTWGRVGTVRTSAPFVTAVATSEGSVIYALTGEHGKVLVIDPSAQRELGAISVGRAPSLALIAP